jgi:hypothetical protein
MPKVSRKPTIYMHDFCSLSQSSQQEKLEQRKPKSKEIRDNESYWSPSSLRKSRLWMCLWFKKQDKTEGILINTTEKQAKYLANDMYINQMKINA